MRDPNRIKPLLAEIEIFWNRFPDFRLSQLVLLLGKTNNISEFYDVEDDIIMRELEKLNANWKK